MNGSVEAPSPDNLNYRNSNQKKWELLELVQVAEELCDLEMGSPMQLLKWSGRNPETQGPIVVLSGFSGTHKPDAVTGQLFQKAIQSGVVIPFSDIYFCPMTNPTSNSKNPHLNYLGSDILYDFPTQKKASSSDRKPSVEAQTLQKWLERIKPIAVISLVSEIRGIHSSGCPGEILDKFRKLSERDIFDIGEYPALTDEETRQGQQRIEEMHQMDRSLGQWIEEQEICYLQISFDPRKKSFDDVREDWKSCVGPALKWLLDEARFIPQEESLAFALPNVVPTLDLPPELANLR
jgi:hypothetical protein